MTSESPPKDTSVGHSDTHADKVSDDTGGKSSKTPKLDGLRAGVQDPSAVQQLDVEQRAESLSQLESEAGERRASDYLPFLDWGRGYGPKKAAADGLAGSLVALLLLPQAMAYAQLAGLPPEVGFYAALIPTLGYALLGSARFLSIGPVALVSLLTGEALTQAVEAGYDPLAAAQVIAAIAGAALLVGGVVGLSRLADLLSRPVLDGFATAAALLIASSQLKPFLGLDGSAASGFFGRLQAAFAGLDALHPPTMVLGLSCLILLVLGGRLLPPLASSLGASDDAADMVGRTTPLLVLAITCGAVAALDLGARGVALVGQVDITLPPFGVPPLELELWRMMLPAALIIALVAFVIGLALGQSLSGREDRVEPRQEMLGIGLANGLAAVSGAFPVGASVSRSSVLRGAGAGTPLAAALAGVVAVGLAFLAAPVVALLPKAALAALILTAALGMIKPRQLRRTWKIDRFEGASLTITFLAVLALGVDRGLCVGIITGLVFSFWRKARPQVVIEGWKESSQRFAEADDESVETPEVEPLLLVRIDGALDFSNARHVRQRLFEVLYDHPGAFCLVIDLSSCNMVDGSALNLLDDLIHDLGEADVLVAFAQPKARVLDKMRRANLIDVLGEDLWFDSTAEAVEVMKERCQVIADQRS